MMQVLSRHRLPQPYRTLLIVFWLLPLAIIVGAILIGKGMTASLFDPRFLIMLALLCLPAWYIWQEGVDVLDKGIRVRVYVPRFHEFEHLQAWHLGDQPQRRVLTIWNQAGETILQCHAVHLTGFVRLKTTLSQHVRYLHGA